MALPVDVDVTGRLADAHVYTGDLAQMLRCRFSTLDLSRDEQIELFLALVIPEFRVPNAGTMLHVGRMLVVALVGHADPSIESAKTDLLVQLEGVVARVGCTGQWENGTLAACPAL